ncbi:RNA-binding protein rnp24 [Cyphellophora attinorum]|uniref:RNA-binding protein rnp24 n=1 Tax=Cyphellophora attinorum TaxID=1664694 RepID=A0A0N0NJU5_9EURO|nr:RNA-binding protein rnp24 [Phialophora attinorum]KPI37298.1 RNA-binding protein rnp24 [Phialophora attinorum]
MSVDVGEETKGRKRTTDEAELEIDVNAPEPPSKKALRKAKKQKTTDEVKPEDNAAKHGRALQVRSLDSNLAFTIGKKDVLKFLTDNQKSPIPANQITRLHLPPGRDMRSQNKGFAYVDFTTQEWVDVAVGLSETLLTGRPLLIKDAHNFEGRPETSKTQAFVESQAKAPSRKIFVGNLPFDTTKEFLEKHFRVCGKILKTQVATFEDSGKCKGYAWVEFEELEAAETAMKGRVTIDHPKSPTGKKTIYLSRMGENKLRMEFAEDATTRYNKRYGRQSGAEENRHTSDGIEEVDGTTTDVKTSDRRSRDQSRKSRRADRPARKLRAPDLSRYSADTVQKLTGGIVESKGQKISFD